MQMWKIGDTGFRNGNEKSPVDAVISHCTSGMQEVQNACRHFSSAAAVVVVVSDGGLDGLVASEVMAESWMKGMPFACTKAVELLP